MKAVSLQNKIEFRLQVDGENWNQGDRIQGLLILKNHSALPQTVNLPNVVLAAGELKKVQSKADNPFNVVTSQAFPDVKIEPMQSATLPWSFQLDPNCPITDQKSSLFLLFGPAPTLGAERRAHLQLVVKPLMLVQEILKVFTLSFRFILKTQKQSDQSVETKLVPPNAKEFAMIDSLYLISSVEDRTLKLTYHFEVKKIDASVGSMKIRKEVKKFLETYVSAQTTTESGRFNQDTMRDLIAEVLSRVTSKVIL